MSGVHHVEHHYFGDGCLSAADMAVQVDQLARVEGVDAWELWEEVGDELARLRRDRTARPAARRTLETDHG